MRALASSIVLSIGVACIGLVGCQKSPDADGSTPPEVADPEATRLKSTDSFVSKERVVDPETLPGATLYRQHCSSCHEGQVPKAPTRVFLNMLSADSIHRALTTGIMQIQAAALNGQQRREVADYLGAAMGTGGARNLQRLGFARMLIHRPRWIFLQNATESLSPADELAMTQLLHGTFPQATIITIGHSSIVGSLYRRHLVLERMNQRAHLREVARGPATTPAPP